MNVTVDVAKSAELEALIERASTMPLRLLNALSRALKKSGPIIVGNSLNNRFLGTPGPFPVAEHKLGRVSGRLRQSITNSPPQIEEATGSVSMAFGSNVKYFAIHEFGFSGQVPVRAHQRNGRPVRAHSRFVKVAARAPMRTELEHPRTTEAVLTLATREITAELDAMEGGPA